MRTIHWTVKRGARVLARGSETGAKEREVMDRILRRELGEFDVEDEVCYKIEVGSSLASVYGDEFERAASASSIDESNVEDGYLFQPKASDVGIDFDASVEEILDGWDGEGNVLDDVREAKEEILRNSGSQGVAFYPDGTIEVESNSTIGNPGDVVDFQGTECVILDVERELTIGQIGPIYPTTLRPTSTGRDVVCRVGPMKTSRLDSRAANIGQGPNIERLRKKYLRTFPGIRLRLPGQCEHLHIEETKMVHLDAVKLKCLDLDGCKKEIVVTNRQLDSINVRDAREAARFFLG